MRNHYSKILLFTLCALIVVHEVAGQTQTQPPGKPQEQQKQDPSILVIPSTYVTVPVIVSDRYGRIVTGLNKDQFSVREDGKEQKVDDFSASETPFSVVLLIDTSRSTVRKLGAIQKAAENFIKQLQPRDRVMVLTFDDKINVISDFTGDVSTLRKAIKAAKTGYSTRLYDAIQFAVTEKLAKVQGRKAIVVLTDGVDTASKQATFESTIDLIAGSGIISYAIQYETRNEGAPVMRPIFLPNNGNALFSPRFEDNKQRAFERRAMPLQFDAAISAKPLDLEPQSNVISGQNPSHERDRYLIANDYLQLLTKVSGARHLRADSIENTSLSFTLIANELRNLYTLGYISSNDQRDGKYRSILVSVGTSGLTVRTRDGYRAPKEEPSNGEKEMPVKKPGTTTKQ
ncbi:MAG: VWA domain-containing protein [Acidobacteria bacterium]|nr:VWA domain-containing protein [Acidobacteriota bacterium]MBI3425264.1 VWA domain-containing protein [Acidobacteriota bacterium]